ncbi:AMP-binding protein, partial [Actinomadura sp. BRA 177]|nr:AMP-binding protein [Actinomadura sp. BRA 177]
PPAQPHRRPAHEQPAPSHVPPPRVQHGAPPPPPPSTSTRTAPAHGPGAPKRPANRALIGVAAAALTVIVGIGAWALSGTGGDNEPGGGGATDKSKTSAPPQPTVVKLQAQGVQAVQQSRPGHQDTSIGKNTDSVIDGKASGNWETQSYADAGFGNYSKGMGVLLDMGKPVKVANVKIVSPESGGTLQVKVGDSQSPSDLKRIGEQPANGSELTVTASPQVTGQYVLVWFTKLPSSLKGKLGEVTVYGAAG